MGCLCAGVPPVPALCAPSAGKHAGCLIRNSGTFPRVRRDTLRAAECAALAHHAVLHRIASPCSCRLYLAQKLLPSASEQRRCLPLYSAPSRGLRRQNQAIIAPSARKPAGDSRRRGGTTPVLFISIWYSLFVGALATDVRRWAGGGMTDACLQFATKHNLPRSRTAGVGGSGWHGRGDGRWHVAAPASHAPYAHSLFLYYHYLSCLLPLPYLCAPIHYQPSCLRLLRLPYKAVDCAACW